MDPQKLSKPRIIAMDFKSLCFQSQVKPSRISVRNESRSSLTIAGLKVPVRDAISPAQKKNVPASTKNGSAIARPSKRLPSGGPIKVFVSDSADHIRPFAFSRFSSATTDGISVCALLSRKTSMNPKSSAVISKSK
ncbi:unannotated protein [freshwater metagenome]|uniref:Unannotated protein n=1 Tax=freshwater metagenome TaxID=449393 RepID=A0A6J6P8I2_9ZZZZ